MTTNFFQKLQDGEEALHLVNTAKAISGGKALADAIVIIKLISAFAKTHGPAIMTWVEASETEIQKIASDFAE